MPPRNPELPEGTDHIINGAMDTGTGSIGGGGDATSGGFGDDFGGGATTGIGGGGTGFGGAGGGGASPGGTAGETTGAGGTGFVASGGGDDTGGTVGGGTAGGGAPSAPVKQQVREGVQTLKTQAGDKIRTYAVDGKERATSALDDFAQVVTEAAASIEERLGSEYGQYARRAADAVSGYAENLRGKDVDELFDDARNLVRRSPGVAIGAAAAVGFVLVRLIKSGLDDSPNASQGAGRSGGSNDVEFQPDSQLAISPESGGSAAGTSA